MSVYEKTARQVLSVPRQLASVAVRRAALEQLRPGDVVLAVDPETHAPAGTRRLTGVDALDWPRRYVAEGEPAWEFDADGRQLLPWLAVKPDGLLLVRPWLSPGEAEHALWESSRPVVRPAFSWALYERHMGEVAAAVLAGDDFLPEAPWRED